ncbi:MAG: glycoside hydrolase family 3 C-terminal domain-containing protein, partial [Lachnospiraceae bacterium]
MRFEFDWKTYAEVSRQAVAEGCVLLRNDKKALPIRKGETVSVFGRIQFTYYKSGTGSGGMVNTPYAVSILDALKEEKEIILNEKLLKKYEEWVKENPFDTGMGWAMEPWCQKEMEISLELAKEAAEESDIALIILGRTAGEDKDNSAASGSYLLTKEEELMIKNVCAAFSRVAVILNVGNIIDMSFVDKYCPQAVMYVWQGGTEGGHGTVDVLTGRVNPSGRLTDTIAADIDDYPSTADFGDEVRNYYREDIYIGYRYFETIAKDKVLYPFGYGLSYTDFSYHVTDFQANEKAVTMQIAVKNIGEVSGKEVMEVYYNPPQGALSKPLRNLIRFAKTKELQPGETQILTITFDCKEMASFDDSGATGHPSCSVLEKGDYEIYVGEDVRNATYAGSTTIPQTMVTEELTEACAPVVAFERMKLSVDAEGNVLSRTEPVPLRTINPAKRMEENRPCESEYTGNQGYTYLDVIRGEVSDEDFLKQLTDEDLICMSRGEGMCSSKVTPGIAGSFGGVTEHLKSYGIPIAGCADGPSGIRMDCGTKAFALPNGTSLACTFNLALVEELYEWEGKELRENKIDTLLGPGINIHRNPLNGRNFEYFSEDPYLTGSMATAMLRGMGKYGVTGTIKHFAANNQEYRRHFVEAVVSQRALREIYLKGFEIAVKQGHAYSIMTTYGPINGIWTAGNYDLNTIILRKDWGYKGLVMTD